MPMRSIHQHLRRAILIFTLTIVAASGLAYFLRLSAHGALEQSFQKDLTLLQRLPPIRRLVRELDFDLLSFISSGDTKWLEKRERDLRELSESQTSINQLADTARERSTIGRLNSDIEQFLQQHEQLLSRHKAERLSTDVAIKILHQKRSIDSTLKTIPDLYASNRAELERSRQLIRKYSFLTFVGIALASSFFALMLATYLSRLIAGPLLQLARSCKDWQLGSVLAVNPNNNIEELSVLCRHLGESSELQNFQYEELRRLNSELDQFAHVVSHDLNSPLITIQQSLDLMRSNGVSFKEQDEQLFSIAERTVKRMLKLVSDLLAFALVSRRSLDLEQVEIQAIVDDVLEDLSAKISQRKAKIEVHALPALMVDRTRMTQLFQNLISNALKYSSLRDPLIAISAKSEGESWRFCIQDNGEGIKPENTSQLFDAFFRSPEHTSRSGHGLGLSICKKIVELHGGEIWVESKVGEGSQFFFSIPDRS